MISETLIFQKDCFFHYLKDIRKLVSEIPNPYVFPDGNPIQPVIPVKTAQNSIMIIGAFPSARFESRTTEQGKKVLIPVANNLSPFGQEEYFDGSVVRTQASRESLDRYYFNQLNIDVNNIWLTDLVKVYLYPDKHIKNCELVAPNIKFINTHKLFEKIAKASMAWMKKEIIICNPKLIITLGEVSARVIAVDKKTQSGELLNGDIRTLTLDREYKIAHLAHPEIRRLNKEWDKRTENAIEKLSKEINQINLND
jgi:hypothetical protein